MKTRCWKILKNIERLAVDSNPIISALIGGKGRDIFLKVDDSAFYTTAFNFREVEKYIPVLSSKRKLPLDDLYLALSLLPLTICDEEFYKSEMSKSKRLIEKRDPDDAHLLALALKLKCPIWSNDKDFEDTNVKVYSTLDLLKLFERL